MIESHAHDYAGVADTVDTSGGNAQEAKEKTSQALDSVASRVDRAGQRMSDRVATVADKAASALGSTAEYVRDFDSRDVMDDMKEMAKRHPVATLATAALVGFLVGRSASRA